MNEATINSVEPPLKRGRGRPKKVGYTCFCCFEIESYNKVTFEIPAAPQHEENAKLKRGRGRPKTITEEQRLDHDKERKRKYEESTKGQAARDSYEFEEGQRTRAEYKDSDEGRASRAEYEDSAESRATRGEYENSAEGRATRAAYEKTAKRKRK
jgi:hypothetical protein